MRSFQYLLSDIQAFAYPTFIFSFKLAMIETLFFVITSYFIKSYREIRNNWDLITIFLINLLTKPLFLYLWYYTMGIIKLSINTSWRVYLLIIIITFIMAIILGNIESKLYELFLDNTSDDWDIAFILNLENVIPTFFVMKLYLSKNKLLYQYNISYFREWLNDLNDYPRGIEDLMLVPIEDLYKVNIAEIDFNSVKFNWLDYLNLTFRIRSIGITGTLITSLLLIYIILLIKQQIQKSQNQSQMKTEKNLLNKQTKIVFIITIIISLVLYTVGFSLYI